MTFAVCTYEISIWRHVENMNKQCRVVRIRLTHQIKKTFEKILYIRAIEKLIGRIERFKALH